MTVVDVGLDIGRPGGVPSGYASVGDQIGGHASDYVDGGLITKLSQERVAPGLFLLSGVLTT